MYNIGTDGKQPYDFTKPNSHPVHYTGLYSARKSYYSGKQRIKGPGELSGEGEEDNVTTKNSPDAWKKFNQNQYFAPLDIPPPSRLPPNWSDSEPIPENKALKVYDAFYVFIPFDLLASDDSMDIKTDTMTESVFYTAWSFFNKAICSANEGSRSEGVSDRHFFHLPADAKEGTDERFPPKISVYGELVVQMYRTLLAKYILERYPNTPHEKLKFRDIITEVEFRRRLTSKENITGIRFTIFVLDKKFNLGRCLQKRLEKNALLTGKLSGIEICALHDKRCENWKKKISFSQRAKASDANQDLLDTGPEVDNGEGARTLEEQQLEKEIERVLGDEAPEREPRGESTGGGNGRFKNLDQDSNNNNNNGNERQKEAKIKEAVDKKLAGLGMRIPNGDKDRTAYKYRTNHHLNEIYSIENAAKATGGIVRVSRQYVPTSLDKQKEIDDLLRKTQMSDWHRLLITSTRELIRVVYSSLLSTEFEQIYDVDTIRNETQDIGDYSNPFNPRKFFTFNSSMSKWVNLDQYPSLKLDRRDESNTNKDKDSSHKKTPCPEQADEANYCDPITGMFQFPIPSLVWKFPDGTGFKLKRMKRHKAFWTFSAFQEQLASTQKKADDKKKRGVDEILEDAFREEDEDRMAGGGVRVNMEDADDQAWKQTEAYQAIQKNNRAFVTKHRRLDIELRFLHPLAQAAASLGIENSLQKAKRAQRNNIVSDVIATDVLESDALFTEVNKLGDLVPEDKEILIKHFRQNQFIIYKERMRPGATGINEIHKLHNQHLNDPDEEKNTVHFNFAGFKNLTYFGSIIGEFLLNSKVSLGISNGHHIFQLMVWNVIPNAYRERRRIGLHVMKIGGAGIGKSHLDKTFVSCKVPSTVMEILHQSNQSKMVEECQNDRVYVEDEASASTIGDSTKANGAREHQAITLMKAWLSNDTISFMVWAKHENGETYQKRKIISARGCHCVNANIQSVNKDISIYDRYLIFTIVPWYSPVMGQVDLLKTDIDPEFDLWKDAYTWDLTKLDTVIFRLCKMIDLRAAAPPNIIDLNLHLIKGLPLLARYGAMSDTSKRALQRVLEIAECTTITGAVLQGFAGPWSPTFSSHQEGDKLFTKIKPWNEDMMKKLRYRLFMTPDMTTLVLSQFFRQIIKDYAPWDSISFMARAVLGYTDKYFDRLFKTEAWVDHPDGKIDEKTGKVKRVQLFPFCCEERLLKNRDSMEEVDGFVHDEILMSRRFEVIGIVNRQGDTQHPGIQHKVPLFMYYHQQIRVNTEEEIKERQDEYLKKISGRETEPHKAKMTTLEKPAIISNTGVIDNPTIKEKESSGKTTAPPKTEFDPNWLVFPGDWAKFANIETSALSQNAYKDKAVTEYALRHLANAKKMQLPVLELQTSQNEPTRFKKIYRQDGKVEILMHNIPPIKMVNVDHWTIDPITNVKEKPGPRIMISTMYLYCFRPAFILFELLTAMEYAHTPVLSSPIDIPIRGCEGINHIHTSRPNPRKQLRKSSSSNITTSVIRTLYMTSTSAVFTKFPQECRNLDPDNVLDKRNIEKYIVERRKTEDREYDKLVMDEPGIYEARKQMMKKLTKEEMIEREYQRRKIQEELKNREGMPVNRPYSQLFKNVASNLGNTNEFYEDYHINVEFERWMLENYGKRAIKILNSGETSYMGRKVYYPHKMDSIVEETVAYSPYYRQIRKLFKGHLVVYPTELHEDYLEIERKCVKRGHSDPSSYLLQTAEYCNEKLDRYILNLHKIWYPEIPNDVDMTAPQPAPTTLKGTGSKKARSLDEPTTAPAQKKQKKETEEEKLRRMMNGIIRANQVAPSPTSSPPRNAPLPLSPSGTAFAYPEDSRSSIINNSASSSPDPNAISNRFMMEDAQYSGIVAPPRVEDLYTRTRPSREHHHRHLDQDSKPDVDVKMLRNNNNAKKDKKKKVKSIKKDTTPVFMHEY